jgi:hypothetical protein
MKRNTKSWNSRREMERGDACEGKKKETYRMQPHRHRIHLLRPDESKALVTAHLDRDADRSLPQVPEGLSLTVPKTSWSEFSSGSALWTVVISARGARGEAAMKPRKPRKQAATRSRMRRNCMVCVE